MSTQNYVSIKHIINTLLRDEPYITEINLGDAVEWSAECINLIGVDNLHKEFRCTLDVENYKASLPENFIRIDAIRETDSTISLQETVNKFPYSQTDNNKFRNELHYYIKDKVIFFEFDEGKVEMVFIGYNLDEDGFPQIPDEERVIKAVYWYIAHKLAWKQWAMGKIKDALYVKIEQEYLHYTRSARMKRNLPTKNKMQSIVDQQLQLVPNMHLFRHNMVNLTNLDNIVISND